MTRRLEVAVNATTLLNLAGQVCGLYSTRKNHLFSSYPMSHSSPFSSLTHTPPLHPLDGIILDYAPTRGYAMHLRAQRPVVVHAETLWHALHQSCSESEREEKMCVHGLTVWPLQFDLHGLSRNIQIALCPSLGFFSSCFPRLFSSVPLSTSLFQFPRGVPNLLKFSPAGPLSPSLQYTAFLVNVRHG